MSNVLTFFAGFHPRLDLEEADLALVQRFNSLSEDRRSYKSIITPERLSRHGFYPPALTSASVSTSGEVWTYILFVSFFPFLFNLTLFAISAIKAMSHFSGNLNCPSTFGTTQVSNPTSGRLPPSSTLLTIVSSLVAAASVLPVVVGLPAPPTDQDWGVSR